jgi:hypothetical protein
MRVDSRSSARVMSRRAIGFPRWLRATITSSSSAVCLPAALSHSPSVSPVAARVTALTFEYDSFPEANARSISGRASNPKATRIRSLAATPVIPQTSSRYCPRVTQPNRS